MQMSGFRSFVFGESANPKIPIALVKQGLFTTFPVENCVRFYGDNHLIYGSILTSTGAMAAPILLASFMPKSVILPKMTASTDGVDFL